MKTTPFSMSSARQRQLWSLLGELASTYWEHAGAEETPVLERRGRRRPRRLPEQGRRPEQVLGEARHQPGVAVLPG